MKGIIKKIFRELFFDNSCSSCNKTLDREGFLCLSCLKQFMNEAYLKKFDNFYYVFFYNEKIREVIADYKLRNRKALGLDLALIVRKSLENLLSEEKIDVIIPVPINKKRMKERGFNQVEYILDILKLDYCKIERIKNTKKMYSLENYEKRKANVQNAFLSDLDLSDKKILLVDDIVTSGATIKAMSKEIEKSNKNVDIKVFSIAVSRKFVAK